jgi:hypothetical protein
MARRSACGSLASAIEVKWDNVHEVGLRSMRGHPGPVGRRPDPQTVLDGPPDSQLTSTLHLVAPDVHQRPGQHDDDPAATYRAVESRRPRPWDWSTAQVRSWRHPVSR